MNFIDPRNISPSNFVNNSVFYGISKSNARSLLGTIIGKGDLDPESWQKLELVGKDISKNVLPLKELKLINHLTSEVDGFQKLIFETEDKLKVETVIIPLLKENTVSICLSSQIGCVMGCSFCATARMPTRRNLRSWEIIDQMRQARIISSKQNRKITSAVFMGMGEPFLNYENVMNAAEHFCFPVLNAISSKSITISTVGMLDEIIRFTKEKRPFRLSISLGSAFDHKRQKLVPVASRIPINKIMEAAAIYAGSVNDRVNLAYVCIRNENVGEEDARELAKIIGNTKVRLDLIEVNDSTGTYQPPTSEELTQFRNWLSLHLRQPVVRRYSGGADIRASCGTLEAISNL